VQVDLCKTVYKYVKELVGNIDIFEAQDKLNPDRQKVIKILKVTEGKLGQLFDREAQVLKSLDYPGIPKVEPDGYFLVTTIAGNSLPCLVMEKIAGQDLQDWLQLLPRGVARYIRRISGWGIAGILLACRS
jgi:eukaryotic-like serine/threonine-protein kinase